MATPNDPRPLTRGEIAKIVGDNPRAIRAFERLFELIPPDLLELFTLVEEASNDANTAGSRAQSALDELVKTSRVAKSNKVLTWLSM